MLRDLQGLQETALSKSYRVETTPKYTEYTFQNENYTANFLSVEIVDVCLQSLSKEFPYHPNVRGDSIIDRDHI